MKFFCAHCTEEIEHLETPGDEINSDLVCIPCSKKLGECIKKAKQDILNAIYHPQGLN